MLSIKSLCTKTIYTERSAESYIEEAIAHTTYRGEETPNAFRIKSWLIELHGGESTPDMNQIRDHLSGACGISQLPTGWRPYVKGQRRA